MVVRGFSNNSKTVHRNYLLVEIAKNILELVMRKAKPR